MNMRQREETALAIFWQPIVLGRESLRWKSLNSLVFSPSYRPFLLHKRLIVPLKKITCTFLSLSPDQCG